MFRKRKRASPFKKMMKRKPSSSKLMRRTGGFNMSRKAYKGINKPEQKNLDYFSTLPGSGTANFLQPCNAVALGTAIGATNTMLLTDMPSGSTYNQRIGRKVVLKSILIKLEIVYNPISTTNATGQTDTVRIMLVVDKQANGQLASINYDILDPSLTGSDFTKILILPNNLANKDRFVTLYDKYHSFKINAYTTTSNNVVNRHIKIYKKCNFEVVYNNSSSTATAFPTSNSILSQTNSVSLYCLSKYPPNNIPYNVNNPFSVSLITRVRFTDP